MKLMFLGPPGAGKGSQAKLVSKKYDIAHISTGDMLRTEMKNGTELGEKAKAIIAAGELVPDDIIIAMVKSRLKQDDCKNGFLLDGFPRTIEQAKALDEIVQLDTVINIEVPNEILVDRICNRRVCVGCGAIYILKDLTGDECTACGGKLIQREDDTEETVLNRISVYEKQTKPLIDHYTEKGIVVNINGIGSIDAVAVDVFKVLEANG